MAQIYHEETEKSFRELVASRDELLKYQRQDPAEKALDKAAEYGIPTTHDDLEYIEHRVYHDYVGTVDYDIKDPNHSEGGEFKAWLPYEQDLSNYPEVF